MSEAMWWDPEANDGAGGWRLRRTEDTAQSQSQSQSTVRRQRDGDVEATVVRPQAPPAPHVVRHKDGAGWSDPLVLARIGFVLVAGLLGVLAQLVLHLFDFLVR